MDKKILTSDASDQQVQLAFEELNDAQLALIGGGIGETIL
jgi:hypothetical protein